jgi:hypothetical protein
VYSQNPADAWFVYHGPNADTGAPLTFEELRRQVWAGQMNPSTQVARSGEPWRPVGPLVGFAEPGGAHPAARPARPQSWFSRLTTWQQIGIIKLVLIVVFVPLAVVGEVLGSSSRDEASSKETLASDDGRCQVTVPRGWVKRDTEGKPDELTLLDAVHALNVRVIPERKLAGYDLAGYGALTRDALRSTWSSRYDGVSAGPVSDTTLAGLPAKHGELRMTHTGTPFAADHYVVETPRQFVQILVIGPGDRARWKGSGIEDLVASVKITDPPATATSASASVSASARATAPSATAAPRR